MIDPFISESMDAEFYIPKDDEDLLYHENRYVPGNSPSVIYFPSNLMIFKIMRACIDINTEEDLWFNKH
jgi:hypothetical protein